ncbi:DUF1223 domain-containing protein [Pelagibacterium flavum]|uniref:DUF1223 domain-containing protein n=1 Tax=Pelagibacterium flavum TaxID=2984530 RepID=A0ABY6ISG1_9HYPH|nr:DUF1223 domain-containing protein [Pelagibacterium sp. YIM 151497]MAN75956.1 DUF1223 domain-containing protein [Hyphomicrobiales bacterium]UYQ72369.1 DUF1223 domain-containing protein [Pelagibacterium sp. YIM 151497]|tara:strand:- start:719 stop:1453 length:735 start_codon:yes stop_codon:yes gene_type:complete
MNILSLRLRLALILCLVALPAGAIEIRGGADAVVELFTSQGCSRCPDADRLLARLGEREDVIALAYHIDYWDYIGWEDTFALPANTELQKGYAQSWGKNRIYTPQMVINGQSAVVGSDAAEAELAIERARSLLPVTLEINGSDSVVFSAPADDTLSPAVVWVVPYRARAEVTIERGENSGQALPYTHIVTARQAIGMWDPEQGAEITIPLEEVLGSNSDAAAVIVQEKDGALPGRILGAALFTR